MAVAPAPARPRPGGGRLFIIVGLLLAVLAFAGVFFLGNVLGGGGGVGGGAPTITVVVAKQAIPLRHTLSDSDLDTQKVSGNFASAGNVYTNMTDVKGLIAEIQISKGSIITSDMLARDINAIPAGSAPAYLPLASGYVAMTIPTGEQQGVAGHITIGDYITVISSAQVTVFSTKTGASAGPPRVVSKTVFTNVRVIGLGPASANIQGAGSTTAGGSQTTSGITSSLTIELTQCDAEYFTWFLNNTTVRYTLESFQDYLKTPPSAPDPSCPAITSAQGVSNQTVDARFHFSAL
ncbi:MAG TPA: RcpC/CpaB family pilus assembly protein [Candidatus Dormibacteraeota bacterium]|nr:RcpC/CpaB family pilus assembly protein [Candidatus Dormibacteraeota bacterium]